MARQGILAQSKPAAATNTLLYSAPIDKSAAVVLTVANDGTASAFDVGIKDFDQKVTLDASTYSLHEGDVITNFSFEVDTAIAAGGITEGTILESADQEKRATFAGFKLPDYVEIFVKEIGIRRLSLDTVTGTFAAGETISKGSGSDTTTALIYEVDSDANNTYLYVGPSTINGSGTEFAAADNIAVSGGANGTIISGGVGTENDEFIFSTTTSSGTYKTFFVEELNFFSDRTYRFNVADSSMSGRDFSLSTTENGEWGPDGAVGGGDDGTEYTTGRTASGTPGSANAYIEYDFSANSDPASIYYFYDGGTGTASNANYGGSDRKLDRDTSLTFTELYVYNVEGTWVNSTDTFSVGGTTYTIESQTSGKYGYVRSYDSTTLKIILGEGSSGFAGSDTFFDAPYTGDRAEVTISSIDTDITALDAENYLVNGKNNTANDVYRMTSIVVGAGERVVVESTTQNNSFSLIGFEDTSDEVTVRNYTSA
tara:strand:+ start:1597 stop:3048 length:1452 start_codon:yes stop_codon:yes gene_type:complete